MDMPRQRPPHLQREVNRHGTTTWYVRVGKGPRIRLRAIYGTPQFTAEYDAAVAGSPLPKPGAAAAGTMQWLLDRYRETGAWSDLSAATRRQRENIFRSAMKVIGSQPIARITTASIVASRDKRKDTPAQARNMLDAMRGLFRWALEARHVRIDPTAGISNPARKKGPGFPKWTEAEVEMYERRWPVGTKQRVWLDILLYSGMRRGDAVLLGKQHVRDGIATFRTEKSGEIVEVTIPILPVLQATLEAGPTGDLTYICGERGNPLTKESFGNDFRDACRAAGVNKSAHGLRKMGATRAADNGATVAELEAIFGWQGGGMASLYTREADRRRLAKAAMWKLAKNDSKTSTPAPDQKVRAKPGKPQ